ncbi:Guanyl-specific ribonuclease Sa3 precursor [compost metagenome]
MFGNFEKRLPIKERGYYREYTVRTPGVKSRGARRIVAGRDGELYYSDDHYDSFRRVKEP